MFAIMTMCDNYESRQFFTDLYLLYRPLMIREGLKYIDDLSVVEDLIHDAFIKFIEKEELLRSFSCCTLRTYIVYTI